VRSFRTAFVGNQFVIQNGGFFNTLILYANSTVGVRELTNSQTGNIPIDNGITVKGDLISSTVGSGLQLKGGSNAKIGTATLTAGTVTVSTTAVTPIVSFSLRTAGRG